MPYPLPRAGLCPLGPWRVQPRPCPYRRASKDLWGGPGRGPGEERGGRRPAWGAQEEALPRSLHVVPSVLSEAEPRLDEACGRNVHYFWRLHVGCWLRSS